MLHRNLLLIFIAIFALLPGCRSGSDTVAVMKSGNITRSEFHLWLESRGISPAGIYYDRKAAIANLRQMGIERLTLRRALSEKFDETPLCSSLLRAVYCNYLSSFYKEKIKQDIDFDEKGVELSIIQLSFKPLRADAGKETGSARYAIYADKRALAEYIISELEAGRDFKELAEKFSEDPSSSRGGDVGVYPFLMAGMELSRVVAHLAEGEFTASPVETGDAFIVAKAGRLRTLNKNNSAGLIKDKKLYNEFMELLASDRMEYIIAERGRALDVKSYINSARFHAPSEILFTVNGETFISSEFEYIMGIFRFFNPAVSGRSNEQDDKRRACGVLMNERILAMAAAMDNCDSDPEFIKRWSLVRESTLSGAYKYDRLLEILKSGEAGTLVPAFKNRLKRPSDKANSSALDSQVSALKDAMEVDILSRNNFFICEDKLF